MSSQKTRIFIVDTLEIWRKILINYISQTDDMEVVGEISSGQGAILMLEEINPDVIMLEVSIKERIRITDIISHIHQIAPQVRVILCVDSVSKKEILTTVDLGIYDFITKTYQKQVVLRVIRDCLANPVNE